MFFETRKNAEYVQHNETRPANWLLRKDRVSSYARVILYQVDSVHVVIPCGASAVHGINIHEVDHLGLSLDHLHSEALRRVPSDVAVSEPNL